MQAQAKMSNPECSSRASFSTCHVQMAVHMGHRIRNNGSCSSTSLRACRRCPSLVESHRPGVVRHQRQACQLRSLRKRPSWLGQPAEAQRQHSVTHTIDTISTGRILLSLDMVSHAHYVHQVHCLPPGLRRGLCTRGGPRSPSCAKHAIGNSR